MKILLINSVQYGSTGKIMFSLADAVRENGGEALCAAGSARGKFSRSDCLTVSSLFVKAFHMEAARITGKNGSFSRLATKSFIKKIERFSPDIIHMHNIHGWYLNLPMLFRYIKHKQIPVVWTLHDCWAFSGHCPHFDMAGCDKWKTGCGGCELYSGYPKTNFDNSEFMYKRKREWFTGIQNLTVVTPSEWLASLVKQSFLSDYPVRVINNGVDLSAFKPTQSSFKKEHGCEGKYIVLGVSFDWNDNKGLDAFIELSKRLDERFRIVLVGTNEKTDELLPKNIISVHRTQSQSELAQIYSAADVFVNPTREDTYPTVNMEALACGIPVVTFKTGGSPEIPNETCGAVVEKNDIDALEQEIIRVCTEKLLTAEMCLNRAKIFDKANQTEKYLNLYEELTDERFAKG